MFLGLTAQYMEVWHEQQWYIMLTDIQYPLQLNSFVLGLNDATVLQFCLTRSCKGDSIMRYSKRMCSQALELKGFIPGLHAIKYIQVKGCKGIWHIFIWILYLWYWHIEKMALVVKISSSLVLVLLRCKIKLVQICSIFMYW